jgi:steroid delta-isomerase-like uncharacterized protein
MSYVSRVLQSDERVTHRTKLHWILYMPGALILVGALVLLAIAATVTNGGSFWYWVVAAFGVVAVGWLLHAWFTRWITEIAVTNRRVIYKTGFIRRTTNEMQMDKVESVKVDQSILGRIFNYGDVAILGTGAGTFTTLKKIAAPIRLRNHITGKESGPDPGTPAWPAGRSAAPANDPATQETLERNRAIARSIFEVGLNLGDADAIATITAKDFVDHDIHVPTGRSGREDMRQALVAIRTGFPDIQVTVEQTIAEGEWVATRNTWRGTHLGVFEGVPPTGNRIEITGIVLWRVVGGLIKERRATPDTAALAAQLVRR